MSCKGLTYSDCSEKSNCIYTKGKRRFCRKSTNKNKKSHAAKSPKKRKYTKKTKYHTPKSHRTYSSSSYKSPIHSNPNIYKYRKITPKMMQIQRSLNSEEKKLLDMFAPHSRSNPKFSNEL